MERPATAGLRTCEKCGKTAPAGCRVCIHCGTALPGQRPVAEIRRSITVVQSDLKGSTALGEKLDPESLREVMTRYIDEMRAVFEGHGGTIEKIIGDAIIAVFGMPVRHDDDALRALEAAAESQTALASLNDLLEASWGVRLVVRTGVASGEVVLGDVSASQHVLTGETMLVAGAMEQNASPLEVRVADSTRRLVGDRVVFEPLDAVIPTGSSKAVDSWRLVSIARPSARGDDDSRADARVCSNCGQENPSEARFCGTCASPLAAPKARESRKTVTIVFADPKPSTADGSPPPAEAIRDVMARYFEAMQVALERHGGTVEKFIGDAVMAVFGLPVRHEDDAVRAARAALDMQASLPALNEVFGAKWGVRLGNHIGVNTGEVIAGDATLGQRLVTGDAVNVAARLEQSAHAGEVIVGDLTYRLAHEFVEVQPIEPLTLKGKSEPVAAYRLLRVRDAAAERPVGDAPFVGRELEMARLHRGLEEAETSRRARMLTVVGDAGVGKSRLIREFAARAGRRAAVLRGRCLPYGDGITFWPLAEIVREAAGITAEDPVAVAVGRVRSLLATEMASDGDRERVVERVTSVIGLSSTPFPLTEIFWGARKMLESIGRRRPLLMLVDDIHSAEQTFLDFLDHLEEAVGDASLLILCSARHELAERHPDWAGAHVASLIRLEPLSDAESGRVVEQLLGGTGLDAAAIERITAAAEGNPLFVEQLVSMLIDNGTLQNENGRWIVASAGEITIPPSITALLAARLDSLPDEERGVLEPASVIGLSFPVPAVEELTEADLRPTLRHSLESVERKQFVRGATMDEDEAYRFAHILVRDTMYNSLLKRTRAGLHERFVDWAERINAERGRGQEFEEIHGYHLEQAYRYRTELGVVDESAQELGRRAAAKLSSAGRRAFIRGDMPAASSLLARATDVLPRDHDTRLELLPDLAEALIEQGEFARASAVLDDAVDAAQRVGARRVEARTRLEMLAVRQYTGSAPSSDASEDLNSIVADLTQADDAAGLCRAWRRIASAHASAGHYGSATKAAQRMIDEASRAGDTRLLARGVAGYASTAILGPMPARSLRRRCVTLLEQVRDDRKAEAVLSGVLAQANAMLGEFEVARALYRHFQRSLVDLGPSVTASSTSLDSARVEILAGDLSTAESELRRDDRQLRAMNERYFRSTVAGLLSGVLYASGQTDEAATYAAISRELADDDDAWSQVLWRSTLARTAARSGASEDALRLAREAVAISRTTDNIDLTADAYVTSGDVCEACGNTAGARAWLRDAERLYARKQNVVMTKRVRDRLRSGT